jgi:hypothetical protein
MKRISDKECIVGRTFGKLTVVSQADTVESKRHRMWRCRCICGKEATVRTADLSSGNTKSCGCGKMNAAIDRNRALVEPMIGKQFGKLFVIDKAGVKNKLMYLRCRCDCGAIKNIRATSLRYGNTQSCGCSRRATAIEHITRICGDITRTTWASVISGARLRGIPIEISIEEAWDLFVAQGGRCALSGATLKFRNRSTRADDCAYASLDRIDSSDTYRVGNVQWVSIEVNMAKQRMSNTEFVDLCKRVSDYNE